MRSKEVLIIEETSTKERVYQFIIKYISDVGYAPTVREICKAVDLKSTSSVYAHLVHLETEGRIKTKEYSPRAIKVIGYEYRKSED